MKRSLFLLLILYSYTFFGQSTWDKIKQRDDVLHFYGSFAINETSYQIQTWAFPKLSEPKKVLISNGVTLVCIFSKEFYDKHKSSPTGFSWDDIFVGSWAIPVYDIFNTCRFDFKHRDAEYKIQEGYYEFNHHYLEKYEAHTTHKLKGRKKWNFKRTGLLSSFGGGGAAEL